jgi:signal transduction histidine kinase
MASVAAGVRHHVRFYEDVTLLAEQVVAHLDEALRSAGAAVAIARPSLVTALEAQLAAAGHDVSALRAQGRLELLDATELAHALLEDGLLSPQRFAELIGPRMRALCAAAQGNPVHAYGEIVDVLWSDGNRAAVIALEQLWSELLRELPFSLMCGYQRRGFDRDLDGFALVCEHHDVVQSASGSGDAALTTTRVLAQLDQHARSLESEVARRTHLERRMLRLLDLSGQLAAANSRDAIGRLTVENGMQAVGAVDAAIWLVDPSGSRLELLAWSSKGNLVAVERYQTIEVSGDTPLAHAIRTKEPVFLGSLDEYGRRFPASRARLEGIRVASQSAFVALPIMIEDRTLGGVVLTFDRERAFTGPDRAFKSILVRQCALALARVEQQEQERALREAAERAAAAEKEARSEIELLFGLISSVNQLDDVTAVFDLALHTVRLGAHSDRAAILLFDEDDAMRFKAAHGLSPTYQHAVEGHSPWKPDAASPVPIAVDDTETDPAWAPYLDVFRAEGIRSLAFVPLVHHRKLIGKFMLYRNEPRPFDARDLQFTATVAVHVAHAVERRRNELELARAFREEREAHMLADEATRAREEILSVVSHDLRSPLGTILMGANALLNVDAGDRGHRARSVGERIHRQAERMARLIEDLVDFAGIQAGQLAIERRSHKPEDIISATNDIFSSMALERGLLLETRVRPGLPPIDCDSERAVQVMSNLVANALKVTPKGGAISIGAEPSDNEVVFFVHDTGPGIDAEELPRLFERYWRGKQTQYKGAGLGLSIARGIVDAHGGRIWAESQPGSGTTFYFSLASLRNN